tara:strand:+ start:1174 stop:4470 length:3297 start_codon:yes stop_codon:yes gene_type:complete
MELNANQQAIYENLQSKYPKVNKDTIVNYLSGNISLEDFKSVAIPKVVDSKSFLEDSGYDVDLMKSSIDKIKKDVANDEKLKEFDLEGALNEYKPSTELLFNSSGIRTDQDLPNDIRGALSLSSNTPADLVNNTRQLLIQDLTEKYGEEKVNKYKKQIVVQNKEVGLEGYKDQGLIFKIPKELGGDNKFYKANQPGLDTGDFFAISGDLLPIAASITGGTFGSVAGPAGTISGSAGAAFVGELARLYMGRKLYNFNPDMNDDEFRDMAVAQSGKYAAIDAAATAAFLPLAAVVKKIVFTTPKEKLSQDTIKKFIDSGGIDKSLKEPLDDARKKIIDLGVAPKDADNYLALEVSKAIPRSGIVEKGTVADKLYNRQIAVAENAGNVKEVEKKILKQLTGLNVLDNASADKAIKLIDDEAKNIRNLELANTSDEAAEAFKKIQRTKNKIFKTETDNIIDEFNIDFAGATGNLEKRIGALGDQIDKLQLTNKITVGPLDLKTLNTANKLIKKYKRPKFKTLTPEQLKKLSPEQQSKYLNDKAINDLFKTLGDEVGATSQLAKLTSIEKGLKAAKTADLSLKDVVQLKTLATNVDQTLQTGPIKNTVRQLKGELNNIIDDALISNPEAAKKIIEFDELLNAKRQSYFQDFAQTFGYGNTPKVKNAIQFESTSLFNKFVSPGPEGLKNSAVLGTLINNRKIFNASSKQRIKAALYEKYLDEVAPTEIGKPAKMTFDKFKETYGAQYKNILGKEYDQFFKTPQKAIDAYDNIIKNTADIQTTFSKALPGIDVNVLDAGAPGQVVESILRLGNKADVKQLITNLNKQSPEMLTNIRQVFLERMIKNTRTQNADLGVSFTGLNGQNLNKFLNENRGTIQQMFNKEFFDVHRSLANALEIIQSPAGVRAVDAPGLTGAANKAGLFVDIFAGPLNHKRLVLNRIARIYDGFDLGGDSLSLLRDYNLFLNGAKKNFMAGNYPKVIDDMLKGTKAERNLADKAIDKVNKFITLGFSQNFGKRKAFDISYRNPLLAKEYIKEKLDQQEDIGEPTPFEPVDAVAKKVAEGLGVAFDATIGNLTRMFLESQKKRRKTEAGREEDIFESEVLEK